MTEFLTWELLSTFAGSVAAVTLITQLAKQYLNLDPKWIALAASILVCVAVQAFYLQDFTAAGLVLMGFNILVVLAAAIGSYEIVKKRVD